MTDDGFIWGDDDPPDPLEAESVEKAVAVSKWRNSKAVAIGDEASGEWMTSTHVTEVSQ